MLKRWISCAAVAAALASSGELAAQASMATVSDIASLRMGAAGGATQVFVQGYYGNGKPGGGTFYLQSSACGTSVPGAITSGSPYFVNYSGSVYVGEPVNDTNLPSNTTVLSTKFTAVPSWGQAHHTGTIDNIPDVSQITIGMRISAPNVTTGSTVASISPPTTSLTTTGSFNNGNTISVTGTISSAMMSKYIVMTNDLDTVPTTSTRSAIKAGTTIVGVNTTANTLTLSDTISGQAGSAQFLITDGGSVTVSSGTVTNSSTENVIFYGRTATLSQSATGSGTSLQLTGDDGGMHIVDTTAMGCYARGNTTSPDVMGWGASCDDTTDDTGPIQNAEIFAEIPNTAVAGSSGSVRFPANNVGACMASNLQILRPVPWLGDGRQQAVIRQRSTATGPLVYVFTLYDTSAPYDGYAHPELAFEDLRLTGSSNNNVGMEVDGYIGGDSAPNGTHLYMRNLTIDQFGGHEMLVDRENQVIGRGFNVQLKGIGFGNPPALPQDCLHVDGPENVWHFYDFIQSGCINGQYLDNTGSWAEFSSVAFSNDHAVTVTGSQFSGTAPVIFTDEEFSNNLQNGFVVDSQGGRVICNLCRVVDTGSGSSSDIEITANATNGSGTVPVLSLIGGSFTRIGGGASHLYNILFNASSNPQTVLVDGTTTTTAANNQIATNLPCTGCVGTVIGDQMSDPILPNNRLTFGGDYTSTNSCMYKNGVNGVALEACDASAFNALSVGEMFLHSGTPTSSDTIQVLAPTTGMTGNYNFVLPTAAGPAGTVLASQGSNPQSWVDVSRQVSSYTNSSGATITVTGTSRVLKLNAAYALFDFERAGPTSAYMDTWDTAANIQAAYGSANVTVNVPLRGVICNNVTTAGVTDTLVAAMGSGVTVAGTNVIQPGTCLHVSLIFQTTGGSPTVTITGA